jgi:hypothetical protein
VPGEAGLQAIGPAASVGLDEAAVVVDHPQFGSADRRGDRRVDAVGDQVLGSGMEQEHPAPCVHHHVARNRERFKGATPLQARAPSRRGAHHRHVRSG